MKNYILIWLYLSILTFAKGVLPNFENEEFYFFLLVGWYAFFWLGIFGVFRLGMSYEAKKRRKNR